MSQVNGDELDVLMTLSVEELQKVSGSMDELIQSSSTAIVKMLEHKGCCVQSEMLHKDIELTLVAVTQRARRVGRRRAASAGAGERGPGWMRIAPISHD